MNLKPCANGLFLAGQALLANVVSASIEPNRTDTVAENQFVDPILENNTQTFFTGISDSLPATFANQLNKLETKFGLPAGNAIIDTRSGIVSSLFLAHPIIPGNGVGNFLGDNLTRSNEEWSSMAVQALQDWLFSNRADLNITVSELFPEPEAIPEGQQAKTAIHGENGDLIQISLPRIFNGVPVMESRASASIKKGNLVNVAFELWSSIPSTFSVTPIISAEDAKNRLVARAHRPLTGNEECDPELRILTLLNGENPMTSFGNGYSHALAWRVCPKFEGQAQEQMEGLVDAHTGRVYSFRDTNQYFEATGSVFPKSNDGLIPGGSQRDQWPMPFMSVGAEITDTGGHYFDDGCQTAVYEGPFVVITDECGPASLIDSNGIDWGSHIGTDCDTPGFGGPGNTHASRTGFYELNKIMEIARSHLPANPWLQRPMSVVVNSDQICHSFWNSVTEEAVFHKTSANCVNSGEITSALDHEWGHGMDWNDIAGRSTPGEGIADVYAALRHGDSCIGRGFGPAAMCGEGDPCISCTGYRDIDYLQRGSGMPHTWRWIASTSNCPGRNEHCQSAAYSEAIWSLYKRVLQDAPYNYDDNTALEIVMRLTFIGSGDVRKWFVFPHVTLGSFGGCGASGYQKFLIADDDDGDLTNGTPHMQAIFKAFNDQEIACNDLTIQDSGCVGTPNVAPVVTASGGDMQASLTWTSVSGTTKYQIFRTEGIKQCAQGKVMVGETTSLTFTDTGLQNGREYYYIVIPKGSNEVCFGPSSTCARVTPSSTFTGTGTGGGTGAGAGSGGWYVNFEEERCRQDCTAGRSCGGLAMPWDFLFDDETACCNIKLPYKAKGFCEQSSLGVPYDGSGKFYTDYQNGRCLKDCDEPCNPDSDCGGIIEDSWVPLYDTLDECCSVTLPWIDVDLCKSNSDPSTTGTDKFYADTVQGKCLRDCNPPPAECVRVGVLATPLFDTISECCDTYLSWVDPAFCQFRSTGDFSMGWHVDATNEICVQDCAVGSGPFCSPSMDPSKTIYELLEQCCQIELNWISTEQCVATSQGLKFFTNKFYVDLVNEKCVQDCDPILPLPCADNPPDSSSPPIYDSADACCQFAFPWINTDKCVADTNGIPLTSVGSGLWYIDWVTEVCIQDCEGAPPCGGLKNTWDSTFLTAEQCCSNISWINPCP